MTIKLVIPRRFNGPPASGHGGFSCGVVASVIGPNAEVTLRLPPPLDTPMTVVEAPDGGVDVLNGVDIVAHGRVDETQIDVPDPVSFDVATDVSIPPEKHPFPTCFACGPDRNDGLALFVGAVPGRDLAAASWVPDPSIADGEVVRDEAIWAALDCPSGWVPQVLSLGDRGVALLGRLSGRLIAPVGIGGRCVVTAWPMESHERKWLAGSAIFGEDGTLRAAGRATWIVLK